MSDLAIRVENLSKRYRIGARQTRHDTLRDALTAKFKGATIAGLPSPVSGLASPGTGLASPVSGQSDLIWALKDVSFEVKRGEVVGIIGRNGAGKSTLLKILSRITKPTTGYADLYGRVASLLEIGTGFHQELTGRENIYLSGAILGMRKAEIDRKFDEIVAFSEIDKFIDTPVKRYSSGMYVRLAFAVAAHLEPEILLVDEVLAVGDAAFQKKCLGKMGDVAREGRTVLFVSHNMAAVRRLCLRGILLEGGRIQVSGDVDSVVDAYFLANAQDSASPSDVISVEDGDAKYTAWELIDSGTGMPYSCYSRDECRFRLYLSLRRTIRNARLGFEIIDSNEQKLIVAHSMDNGSAEINMNPGDYYVDWNLRVTLREGYYTIVAGLGAQVEGQIDLWSAKPLLTVLPKMDLHLSSERRGLVCEDVQFEVIRLREIPAT